LCLGAARDRRLTYAKRCGPGQRACRAGGGFARRRSRAIGCSAIGSLALCAARPGRFVPVRQRRRDPPQLRWALALSRWL